MSERIPRIDARAIVAIRRNFWALLLLRNASPPPPKTGDNPVPGACRRTAAIKRTEVSICRTVMTIAVIISFHKAFAK